MSDTNGTSLNASVLVLNRFYTAIHIITAKKAFCLVFKGAAEIIGVESGHFATYTIPMWLELSRFRQENGLHTDSDWVKTVSLSIEVPKIIRLLDYDKLPSHNVSFNRKTIFARDEHRCQYCGKKFPTADLSIDHVKPRMQGGTTIWTNVVTACSVCNKRKGSRTPAEASMRLLKKPVAPTFSPLIEFKADQPKYEVWKMFLKAKS